MADTPDLSRIVSLIMQNPELIEQISALAKTDSDSKEGGVVQTETAPEAKTVSVSAQPHISSRGRRNELLSAMKPYLSEGRRAAIDSMMSIADILDMMRKEK